MGSLRVHSCLALALVCLALSCSGCRGIFKGISGLFSGDEYVDPELVAKYWDGPRIGPGMTLNIQIGSVMTPTVTMSVLVDPQGDITLQHLLEKPIHCEGMTLEQLKTKLAEEYSFYYQAPRITVTFGEYDGRGVSPWGTVMVMGEVGNPGPVNLTSTMELTVTKVLQLAGGVKPFADTSSIRVMRCEKDGRQVRYDIDLREIGEDGRFDKDMRLKAGDVVYIPESWY